MCPADTIREHIYAEKLRQLRQQLSETFDEVERSEILRQVEEVEAEIERTSRGAQDQLTWHNGLCANKRTLKRATRSPCRRGRVSVQAMHRLGRAPSQASRLT